MLSRFTIFSTLIAGGIGWASQADAQKLDLSEVYGNGYHLYYSGDYAKAQAEFSAAIHLGSDDPRVYYYRGLTNVRMGDLEAARTDFQEGARLEAAGKGRWIDQSLERVQGRTRIHIEAMRRRARIQAQMNRPQTTPGPARDVVPEPPHGETLPDAPDDIVPPVHTPPAPPAVIPPAADPADDVDGPVDNSDPAGTDEPMDAEPAGDEDPFGGANAEHLDPDAEADAAAADIPADAADSDAH